jgi:PAS domain S-box-containing protein
MPGGRVSWSQTFVEHALMKDQHSKTASGPHRAPDSSSSPPSAGVGTEAATLASARDTDLVTSKGAGLDALLVESVRDYAIFALDPSGRILSWNLGAQRLKGYQPNEILGRHFSIFYPPDDVAARKPERELEDAIRDGRVEDEGWRVRKDGSRFWANVVITALRSKAGELVGFAKVTRDLTERRAAEDALRKSEEHSRLLIESVRDYGIFMLDPQGNVATWNAGAARIKGYQPNEILGRHFSVFYTPEDVAAGKPEWELQVVEKEGRLEDEGWRVRKDGSRFWANVVISALRKPNGELVGYAKVTRDLTERRIADERALADARRVALSEEANRAKAGFLAAMSHELRTPLNAIGGYTGLLMMGIGGEVPEQHRQYLERIRGSQQHLLAIINDILNFSRIEAGQITYDIQRISLCAVIDSVVPMIEQQALAKQLRVDRLDDAGAFALADRAKVEQVLLNLLSNAVKFTDPGGRVELSCHSVGPRVAIRVRDTGMGIPQAHLEAIFEPFVQVGRSLTNPLEGTGLGLAISSDLARAMGGELTVESTVGTGSIFTLWLPTA